MIFSVPPGGPYTLREIGSRAWASETIVDSAVAFAAAGGLAAGHWLVLDDDVYIVAACPTREGAEAARRLLSGVLTKPCTCSTILPGGGWDLCPRHG